MPWLACCKQGRDLLLRLGSRLVCSFGLLSRLNADEAAMTATVLKLHNSSDQSEQRVVLPLPDIFASLVLGPALPHKNRACVHKLPAKSLHAEPLSVRIAAIG